MAPADPVMVGCAGTWQTDPISSMAPADPVMVGFS